MQKPYSDDQLRLAARLYYLDGLGQAEVAKFVKVSQAKVSRLLAAARERGIVRISVVEYEPRDQELETRLLSKYPLKACAVIKTTAGCSGEEARLSVAHFGASFVSNLVNQEDVVAIAGGRTMRDFVQHVQADHAKHATVVQGMGSVDSTVGAVDAFELGRELARRWGGHFLTINTPAFVPDKQTRDAFLGLAQIQTVWDRLRVADVALVGIGTPRNSVFVDRGVFSAAEQEQLAASGAVGEICGRFYDAQGEECVTPWRERVIAIELEHVRQIPQVVGIVVGADRSKAIAAAVRGGLLKSLVVDIEGAKALLESQ